MSLQALMALMGHVSPEMTLRYASLSSPTVRAAYEAAMSKVRGRQSRLVAPVGKVAVPDRVEWLGSERLKTRVAHGYCSPHLVSHLADVPALRQDAEDRGWDSEVARHARVIASIEGHLHRLKIPKKI